MTHTVTLVPAFFPTPPNPGWELTPRGSAFRPTGADTCEGSVPVLLPDGVRILSLRALGGYSGSTELVVTFIRDTLTSNQFSADLIARVDGRSNPFDISVDADQRFAHTDNENFKYLIGAASFAMQPQDNVFVHALQITYTGR